MFTADAKAIVLQFYPYFDQRQSDQAVALLVPECVAQQAGQTKPLNEISFNADLLPGLLTSVVSKLLNRR